MRAFAEAWPDAGNCAPAAAQMEGEEIVQAVFGQLEGGNRPPDGGSFVQVALHKLHWYHHIALLDKLKTREDRLWYAQKAIEHNWSRNILVMQIESRLIDRSGGAVTNFALTLPKPQSDLTRDITDVLDSNLKTILHIPHVASRESTRRGKDTEVGEILGTLGDWKGKDPVTGFDLVERADGRILKVADLVDDGPDRHGKALASLKDPAKKHNRYHVDIILRFSPQKPGRVR